MGLLIASVGITAAGRDLLRAAMDAWPGFAVLRDGQQFVAPLALAEAIGFGLLVHAALRHSAPTITTQRQAPDLRQAPDSRQASNPPPFKGPSPRAPAASPRAPVPTPRATASSRPAADPSGTAGAAIALTALITPVLLLPGLAWGAGGRLRPVWYPAGWLAAARVIDAAPGPGKVLLLPWATDRRFAWNGGEAMLDPWPRLLSRPVIWNDGTQVGDVSLAPDDPRARQLNAIVQSQAPLTNALRANGVRYVVVDAGPRPTTRLPGFTMIIDQPGLAVYELTTSR